MKDIRPKLVELFKSGYCTPQIARVAKKLGEPSTTIHYNVKKLEAEGAIKAPAPRSSSSPGKRNCSPHCD